MLSLSLHADSYDWEFIPVPGDSFTDSGTGTCHEGPRSLSTTAVSDSFSRTVSNGWGSAEIGGAWTPSLASAFSVNGTTGRVLHNAAGNGRSAVLNGVSETDLTIATTISIDKPATGSGAYTGVVLRRVSPGNEYVARLRWRSDGNVALSLTRHVNGTETAITPETVIPGATTNQAIRLIADITGTGPTTINARAHAIGAPDPGTWQRTATDTSPTLQSPGAPGIATYLSSSTTNAPLTTTYDDYDAQRPVSGPTPPEAAFTVWCTRVCTASSTPPRRPTTARSPATTGISATATWRPDPSSPTTSPPTTPTPSPSRSPTTTASRTWSPPTSRSGTRRRLRWCRIRSRGR